MEESQAKKKIEELRAEIAMHEKLYRIDNAPIISDDDFDVLMRSLRSLEAEFPQFASPDSPATKVGSDHTSGFETVEHLSPMLSLDNVFNMEELKEFDERLRRILGAENKNLTYCVEPKIDGAGISAVYINGQLSRLLTRGNGERGDDITRNAFVIKNLPQKLSGKNIPELLEIRGEAYMTLTEFERIKAQTREDLINKAIKKKTRLLEKNALLHGGVLPNKITLDESQLQEIEDSLPANPRNLTAGTLKLLDTKILSSRSLEVILYSIGTLKGVEIKKQSELPLMIKSWGLPAVNWFNLAEGVDEVFEQISALEQVRNDFPFNTDGAVIKLEDCSLHALAGMTSHAPRWAAAWKYRAQQAQTILKAITLQVGRTGAVTPVAELKPIPDLSGTTVSRATLHNAGYIEEKDIRIGDTVIVEKAGEIIPAVIGVNLEMRPEGTESFIFPERCPECNALLQKVGDKKIYRCPNLACPPQVSGRIAHFASRKCMDIQGLGASVVDRIIEALGIRDPSDLYTLTKEKLYNIRKFKEKSSENLLSAIEKSKKSELWRLIYGLGILEIGEQYAKELASHFGTLDALMNAKLEEITSIDGLGSGNKEAPAVRAQSIRAFFDDENNKAMIERLRSHGLNFTASTKASGILSGKIFVFTGTLSTMGRSRAKSLVENLGGKVASSVSSKTNYLVAEKESGSEKFIKAKELEVPIINEKEFLELLNISTENNDSPEFKKDSTGQGLLF